VIHFVRLDNRSSLSDQVIRARLHVRLGEPLDLPALEADIGRIYGLESFENVGYDIVEEDGQTGLLITAREKSWGPNYLKFGAQLSADLDGDSSFNLGASHRYPRLNRLGGEGRFAAQIGEEPSLLLDLYQPLDAAGRFFISPLVFYDNRNFGIFAGDIPIAEYQITRAGAEISAGINFGRGTLSELRAGYLYASGDAELTTGSPQLPDADFNQGEVFASYRLDDLDNVNFPRSGRFLSTSLRASREVLGADVDFEQLAFEGAYAASRGRNTLILSGFLGYTFGDTQAPVGSRFRLGGLFQLSGLKQDQISGQHAGLIEAVYMRKIGDLALLPAYAGASLELGNTWEDFDLDDLRTAGSLFIGADSPLGPLYLGWGYAEGGNNSLYLLMGRSF
jgi:NTE family protein